MKNKKLTLEDVKAMARTRFKSYQEEKEKRMNRVIVKSKKKEKATLDEIEVQVQDGIKNAKKILGDDKTVNELIDSYRVLKNNFLVLAVELSAMKFRNKEQMEERIALISQVFGNNINKIFTVATEGNA
ncbi:MAG: hypothetical protein ACFFD1_01995 [Candidatus Thorarchaeota archaeon]